jgi:Icc-related predicted phosphoesterase
MRLAPREITGMTERGPLIERSLRVVAGDRSPTAVGHLRPEDQGSGHDGRLTVLRVAAMADLHYRTQPLATLPDVFEQVAETADVLLLCGDIVDLGLPEEARLLGREMAAALRIPILAVLGNHEHESGKTDEVTAALADAGVRVLDGDAAEIGGVGFAGVKGFAGGFGERALQPWGEELVKAFVREAVNETIKLESALAKLRTPHRIALLHYAPIQATAEGEPPEIFPFLGSSRLEDPLNRYGVTAVFHGHAHRGAPEGRTQRGIPVYNVAVPLLRRLAPQRPPFLVLEVPSAVPAEAERPSAGTDHPTDDQSATS